MTTPKNYYTPTHGKRIGCSLDQDVAELLDRLREKYRLTRREAIAVAIQSWADQEDGQQP